MPVFKYSALSADGKNTDGSLEVTDQAAVIEWLRNRKLTPLHISEDVTAPVSKGSRSAIRAKDILHFTGQLGALVEAGLPLIKALSNLKEQASNLNMVDLLSELVRNVKEGETLSASLAKFPKFFSGMYISMVKSGEMSGNLQGAMLRLTDILEANAELKSKVKSALTYPAVMIIVMIMSLIVMMTFVVPRFSAIFASMGGELPFPTRVLLFISHSMTKGWWVFLILGILLTLVYIQLKKQPEVQEFIDRNIFRLPLLGNLFLKTNLSRISLTLSSLLQNGVPILHALNAIKEVSGNIYISNLIQEIILEVRQGEVLSQCFKKHPDVFPSLFCNMVATGEESGELAKMLERTGKYFKKETDETVELLTTLLEPIIIVVMGLVVGFIVSAILLPIFDMEGMIK